MINYDERRESMLNMKNEGFTYQEIGEKFGISKQRVQQIIGGYNPRYFHYKTKRGVVYEGLRKWLNDNKISINHLTRLLYGQSNSKSHNRLNDYLSNRISIPKSMIDKLLKLTGLTYEVAFKEDKSE